MCELCGSYYWNAALLHIYYTIVKSQTGSEADISRQLFDFASVYKMT
jgi:hypothetical protein